VWQITWQSLVHPPPPRTHTKLCPVFPGHQFAYGGCWRRFKRVHFVVEAVLPQHEGTVEAVRLAEEDLLQKRDELRAFEKEYRAVRGICVSLLRKESMGRSRMKVWSSLAFMHTASFQTLQPR
jgi:hypothetical protein